MSGVYFLLAMAIGTMAVVAVVNLMRVANDDHERAGLYGTSLREHRLDIERLAAALAESEERVQMELLDELVTALDRVAFAGTPLALCTPAGDDSQWSLAFRDGTTVTVRCADQRTMGRANLIAAREPVVVARVQPNGTLALVELMSPRHRPLRVALRV